MGVQFFSFPVVFTSYYAPYDNDVYVVMNGFGPQVAGKRLFKSVNGGESWENINGNLPDLQYNAFLVHPFDDKTMVAATAEGYGIFMTNDGGKNWWRWDEAMPKGSYVTDIDFQLLGDEKINVSHQYLWQRHIQKIFAF